MARLTGDPTIIFTPKIIPFVKMTNRGSHLTLNFVYRSSSEIIMQLLTGMFHFIPGFPGKSWLVFDECHHNGCHLFSIVNELMLFL